MLYGLRSMVSLKSSLFSSSLPWSFHSRTDGAPMTRTT